MINLLPPFQKEEISREKRWKLILILGILLLSFFIYFSLILFSIAIFIDGEADAQKILFKQREEEFKNSKIKTLEEEGRSINEKLFRLNSFYRNQVNITELLERISNTLPVGTYLTNLSFVPQTQKEEKLITVNLSGFSPTREILLEFKKNLEKEKDFKEINFSPHNWVEQTDIDFSVNFKVKYLP